MPVTLRPWRAADRDPFAAMNADPVVMRHFVAPLSRAESDAFLDRMMAHEAEHGFGFRAVEVDGVLAGLCGLLRIGWKAPFNPTPPGQAVEIGWRLLPAFHGRGIAFAAATLALQDGFGRLGLDRIVAFTAPANVPSWRLMERLGMARRGTFEHPRIPEGHVLRTQVWYSLRRPAWLGSRVAP